DCAFANAREFVREIDRILEGAGTIQRQSVFSFISPRMDLDLHLPKGEVEALPTLSEIPIVLSFATRTLSAKIRLHGEGKVRLGFRIVQPGQKPRQVKDEFALGHAESWPGQWIQLSIRDLPPLPPGHYDLTVEGATKSATMSGLLLYAES